MAESEDDSSKTEEPSQKKLEEARKKGQIASSRELNHFFMMGGFLFFVLILGPHMARQTLHLLRPFIAEPDNYEMDAASVTHILSNVTLGLLLLLSLPFLLTIASALAPQVLQQKIVFSTEHIIPKFSKLNPLKGFGRLFGFKAIIEFVKNFSKVLVVGLITGLVIFPYRHELPGLLHSTSSTAQLEYAQTMADKMLTSACIFLFLLGLVDYLYQRQMILKSLRMSKHELKEEYKQQEGDPHVKGKQRQIRRERAKKRMMANVPKADVVITNPTHFAVALHYDPASMQAPKLLAKGADEVAARIREKAGEHKIPIIRNPPLARVLYDTTEIDDEIPTQHYEAVAKIIGYVYKLKGKRPAEPKASGKGKVITMPNMKPKK